MTEFEHHHQSPVQPASPDITNAVDLRLEEVQPPKDRETFFDKTTPTHVGQKAIEATPGE